MTRAAFIRVEEEVTMDNALKVKGGIVGTQIIHHPVGAALAALLVAAPCAAITGAVEGSTAGIFMGVVGALVGAPLGAIIAADASEATAGP